MGFTWWDVQTISQLLHYFKRQERRYSSLDTKVRNWREWRGRISSLFWLFEETSPIQVIGITVCPPHFHSQTQWFHFRESSEWAGGIYFFGECDVHSRHQSSFCQKICITSSLGYARGIFIIHCDVRSCLILSVLSVGWECSVGALLPPNFGEGFVRGINVFWYTSGPW